MNFFNLPIDNFTFVFLALSAIVVLLIVWIILLDRRISKLLKGKGAQSIEESIAQIDIEMKDQQKFRKEMENYLLGVEKRLRKSLQGVSTVRFNPFKGEGGNQSFASAFVNEKSDGIVLSSLYSRGHVGIFCKPIAGGKSQYELTAEEKEALMKAEEMARNS